MAEKYTESQHKATNTYRSKMARIDLTVTVEEKERIATKAKAKGLSIKQYIIELVNNDN